jgi:hypothetical protein
VSLRVLRGAATVTAADVPGSTDRRRTEPGDGLVDRALDFPPVLIVVPEPQAPAAGRTQILCPDTDQPHRVAPINLFEQ